MILQGPHYTISGHAQANRNLLQSEYSGTPPSHLHSFPNAVILTLKEGPKDLFNAMLPVKHALPETAGLVSWASPAVVAQTRELQEIKLRCPWGTIAVAPCLRAGATTATHSWKVLLQPDSPQQRRLGPLYQLSR